MQSILKTMGPVPFAQHIGERVYMREFTQRGGLPESLVRWQPTVDAMLREVDAPGPIYLMIDQSTVRAGASHRRPGVHIDGYWLPSIQAHGDGRHVAGPGAWDTGSGRWKNGAYADAEAIILASDVAAARAFIGEFDGVPGEGGDCRHIDTKSLIAVPMQAGIAYAGNVTLLHESMPVAADCLRTVVRLNVPGWTPK
jgi:hypothetical protein